jgi:hypothetical protein
VENISVTQQKQNKIALLGGKISGITASDDTEVSDLQLSSQATDLGASALC